MSSPASKVNLPSLYSDLIRAGENGEFDKALRIVGKLLHEIPDDEKVLQCKSVCHIHLGEFEEALKALRKCKVNCHFEKAYCFYRLNRVQDAWNTLNDISDQSWKIKELKAQVLYRLERYDESFEIYRDLIKNSDDDYEEERETNLAAVVTSLYMEKGREFKKAPQLREHTYELCYNAACILIAQNKYEQAIEKLNLAKDLCKKTLEENDVTEEEIEAEMGVINVQLGYALQMLNKSERAMKTYNQVLKNKPSDVAIVAVASNNIITINKDQNVFDSKKKIKIVTSEALDSKLTSMQRQAIALNHCLLLLNTNQIDQCKKQIQYLSKNFPAVGAEATLLLAAVCCKEKKVQKAVDALKEYATAHPEQSNTLSFTLVQLLLSQGHISQACDTLKTLGNLSYSLGVLSALVTLYLNLEERESATDVMKDAIKWYKKKMPQDNSLNVIMRETAKMELHNRHPEEAAKLLEELRKANPQDQRCLAQLISAYSQFNPQKAKEISKELPPWSDISSKIDIETLESTNWTMGAKYVKRSTKAEPSSGPHIGSSDAVIQKKKRKHKKGKRPKNFDPNVIPDPERWLPKRERSTYKKKKDKRGGTAAIGKGTQGAISGMDDNMKLPTSSPSPSSAVPDSPNVQGQRQKANKKKKKGRW